MVPVLDEAVERLGTLPGIGERSALRLALWIMRQPQENIALLGKAIVALGTEIKYCSECQMISESERCPVCQDPKRDHSVICVVESVRDVMSIEQTGEYNGLYHVLGGVISPIDGIGPDDLSIPKLVERASNEDVSEVILAISKGMEGETTSYYINKLLSSTGVKVSAIARGVGFGDDLEYTDPMTLGMSIKNRVSFNR